MKTTTRWSIRCALATMLFPAISYARPIPAISHSRVSIAHDRSPHIQNREATLRHS